MACSQTQIRYNELLELDDSELDGYNLHSIADGI